MSTSLASLGWTGRLIVPAGLEPGRVVRSDRGISTVLTANGPVRASLGGAVMSAAAADPVAFACTGDWVALRRWPDDRITIELVLPRRTAIIRRTAGKDSTGQVLAANVDTAAVVASLDPTPELATIERLLALAWDSGAKPYLILTKADVVAYPQGLVAQLEEIAPGR
jgi:ribosome biogenesis GTPase